MLKTLFNILAALALMGSSVTVANSQTDDEVKPITTREEAIERISEHFTEVPTMAGEFIQFGPRGNQTGGKFYIQRPGKIRFIYQEPSPIRIISNGRTVAVNNRKLKTWSYYPLRKTPLSLVLGTKTAIDAKNIHQVDIDEDLVTIVMGDDKVFGNSIITMMFDPKTLDLRQWVIRDAQGKETTVMIFNVVKNIKIPARYFIVDEMANQKR